MSKLVNIRKKQVSSYECLVEMERDASQLVHLYFQDANEGLRDVSHKRYRHFEESLAGICARIRFKLLPDQIIKEYGMYDPGKNRAGIVKGFVKAAPLRHADGTYDEYVMPVIDEPEMIQWCIDFPNIKRFATPEFKQLYLYGK